MGTDGKKGMALNYKVILAVLVGLLFTHVLGSDNLGLTGFSIFEQLPGGGINQSPDILSRLRPPNAPAATPENITEETVLIAIADAQRQMEEMARLGFSVSYLNDTLYDARHAYAGENVTKLVEKARSLDEKERFQAIQAIYELQRSEGGKIGSNYTAAYLKAQEVNQRRLWAFNLLDALTLLKTDLDELNGTGLNLTTAYGYYDQATASFQEERFDETAFLVEKSYKSIEDAKVEAARLSVILKTHQKTLSYFMARNWRALLFFTAAIIGVCYIIYNEVFIYVLRNKIKQMTLEKDVIDNLLRKAQRDYYREKKIAKNMFDIKMDKYRERQLEINKDLPVMRSRLDRCLDRRLHSFVQEKLQANVKEK